MSNEFNKIYEFGGFRFDARTGTLERAGEPVSLSPKATELLRLLLERGGELVTKQEIFAVVWAETFVEDGVLTQNIYTLRQTLGTNPDGKQIIENVPRRGYRFNAPVTRKPDEKAKPAEGGKAAESPKPEPNAPPFTAPRKSYIFPVLAIAATFAGIILLSVIGYRFLATGSSEASKNPAVELKFKQLTDTGDVSYLTVSPDGRRAAYTRGFEIYVQNLETGDDTKLKIENAARVACLQFSPVDDAIYFGTVYNRDEKGSVYRVSSTGGAAVEIAENVWSGFSLSPDGTQLAFARKFPAENRQALVIKNLAAGEEKMLASVNLPEEFYWNNYPAWSADGKKIALVVTEQTEHFKRIVIFENGAARELKLPDFRNVEQVVWSADANHLIAAANDGNNFQLWKIDVASGAARRITNDLNSYLGISVSADRQKLLSRQRVYFSNIWVAGKDGDLRQLTEGTSRNDGLKGLAWIDDERIVYSTNDEKIRDWNLWLLNASDGAKRKLTDDAETQNDNPAIAPDRKTIYFASDRNRQSRIWRLDADGNNPEQVTFGEDETHHFPQISPDGKWLYFIIKSGRNSTVGRKSLTENSVQELSGKIKFTPGNFLSISPDGRFLAFQNIAYQSAANSAAPRLQAAVLSTENPDNVRFIEIEAWTQILKWSADSRHFDFIVGNIKENSLARRSIEDEFNQTQILPSANVSIFNFAWSPNGENLAVARGQLLRDVVLLTNFE
jgi:Tol biopolymer transport system component/DNA-binding winged helix-turn-helix (wHTH) protein